MLVCGSGRYFHSLAILVLSSMLIGCGAEEDGGDVIATSIDGKHTTNDQSTGTSSPTASSVILREDTGTLNPTSPLPSTSESKKHPTVQIKTSLGEITVRLDATAAPQTVENFLKNYVSRKHYDKTIFHYVEEDYMILGGGFTQELQAKETRTEIINEADNGKKNLRGTIGMARDPEYVNSATCQFYINLVDNPSLDHKSRENDEDFGYCVFGEVIQGMDIVEKIAQADVQEKEDFPNLPLKTVLIQSVRLTR